MIGRFQTYVSYHPTVSIRVRILYLYYRSLHTISPRHSNARPQDSARYPESPDIGHLVSRSLLCPLVAYHHDEKTPIHLLAAGLTTSGSCLVYSNPRIMHVA